MRQTWLNDISFDGRSLSISNQIYLKSFFQQLRYEIRSRYYVATGEREIVLATKSGWGCTRSFRERNKWHLRGSIYRLIWISRTSDAFLPSLLPLVSRLFLSSSLFSSLPPFLPSSSVSHSPIFIAAEASIHPVVPQKGCLRSPIVVVAPSSLHSTLNVSWWKSLLCRRFYPLPQVNSFERLDSR